MLNDKNELTNLLHDNSTNHLKNYLKILYSPSFAATYKQLISLNIHTNDSENPLANINFDSLRVEQQARQRNLFKFIQTGTPILFSILDESFLKDTVASYCDSEEFWEYRGRTLIENFCMYLYKILMEIKKPQEAEFVKLQGIISGLTSTKDASSPWQGSQFNYSESPQSKWEESYLTHICLVDKNGELNLSKNTKPIVADFDFLVSIVINNKSTVEIHCNKARILA